MQQYVTLKEHQVPLMDEWVSKLLARSGRLTAVPKIHWKSGPVLDEETDRVLQETARDQPDFEVVFIDDAACVAFMQHFCSGPSQSSAYAAFQKLIPGAYKSDLFRACLLHRYGGVWGDMKQKYLVPFSEIFDLSSYGVQLIDDIVVRNAQGQAVLRVYNAFFAASPKSSVLQQCIDTIVMHVQNRYMGFEYPVGHLAPTGPYAWQKAFDITATKQNADEVATSEVNRKVGRLLNCRSLEFSGLCIVNVNGTPIVWPKHHTIKAIVSGSYHQNWKDQNVYAN